MYKLTVTTSFSFNFETPLVAFPQSMPLAWNLLCTFVSTDSLKLFTASGRLSSCVAQHMMMLLDLCCQDMQMQMAVHSVPTAVSGLSASG
eukprot:4232732-Amphidinium_carterae.1